MSFLRLFSKSGLRRLSPIATDLAHNPEALKALDKELLHTAKQQAPMSSFIPAYNKFVARPAASAGSMLYGSKMDAAKMLATAGGFMGGIRYGGTAARPMYNYLSNIANTINKDAMGMYAKTTPDSVVNIVKPATALTSKPLMALDKALFGSDSFLNLAEHPVLASMALPLVAYGGFKGGSALLSRLGRARRLSQLRRGIAPRAYRQFAQQLGFQ